MRSYSVLLIGSICFFPVSCKSSGRSSQLKEVVSEAPASPAELLERLRGMQNELLQEIVQLDKAFFPKAEQFAEQYAALPVEEQQRLAAAIVSIDDATQQGKTFALTQNPHDEIWAELHLLFEQLQGTKQGIAQLQDISSRRATAELRAVHVQRAQAIIADCERRQAKWKELLARVEREKGNMDDNQYLNTAEHLKIYGARLSTIQDSTASLLKGLMEKAEKADDQKLNADANVRLLASLPPDMYPDLEMCPRIPVNSVATDLGNFSPSEFQHAFSTRASGAKFSMTNPTLVYDFSRDALILAGEVEENGKRVTLRSGPIRVPVSRQQVNFGAWSGQILEDGTFKPLSSSSDFRVGLGIISYKTWILGTRYKCKIAYIGAYRTEYAP